MCPSTGAQAVGEWRLSLSEKADTSVRPHWPIALGAVSYKRLRRTPISGWCQPTNTAGRSNSLELLMSRNEIEDVLTLETSDSVLRHRRGAIEALLMSHGRNNKPAAKRHYRDGDDRHESRRRVAHASLRGERY